jgi:hypothetical protein
MADYKSKLGPIPPENFDNDPRFVPPEELEKTAGTVLDRLRKKLAKPKGGDDEKNKT